MWKQSLLDDRSTANDVPHELENHVLVSVKWDKAETMATDSSYDMFYWLKSGSTEKEMTSYCQILHVIMSPWVPGMIYYGNRYNLEQ